ncbi:MAG: MiaB/RimO family radical SAM methylthiotransferase [Candidatus Omnitrophica bacterium]|nr:MiaB/RimO family radical SAM methylthiotransferase [Candidatus Omnitrophota bacterium]
MKRSVKFYTFGCKANQYDTQVLREKFLSQGFVETDNGFADVYVVNTCVVTKRAESECQVLLNKLKRKFPYKEVILKGCLKRLIEKEHKDKRFSKDLAEEKITFFAKHKRAFLKIQDGCDNFCAYCIVPYVRGKSTSKPKELVIEEFKGLLRNGYKEVVLTGICLGDYGKDFLPPSTLVALLKELESIEGIFRIRLSSLDPQYIDNELIDFLAKSKKICPHLHIPFQSGDDFILRKMNRKYRSDFAYDIIKRIRKKIPGIIFTTDIMVGFPQEKEENFSNTLTLLEYLKPLKIHIFRFSPRPGTPAESFLGRVNLKEELERFNLLKELDKKFRDFNLRKFLNRKISLLVERRISKGVFSGHSEHYFNVLLEAEGKLIGEIAEVKGKEIKEDRLLCTL